MFRFRFRKFAELGDLLLCIFTDRQSHSHDPFLGYGGCVCAAGDVTHSFYTGHSVFSNCSVFINDSRHTLASARPPGFWRATTAEGKKKKKLQRGLLMFCTNTLQH